MLYQANTDLPSSLREQLPEAAQSLYRETFNYAYAAHAGEYDREQRAHLIAWAALRRAYVRVDGHWEER